MLHVRIPAQRVVEHNYIIEVLLGEFLGLEYSISEDSRTNIAITTDDDTLNRELCINDTLLLTANQDWLKDTSMPELPLRTCHPQSLPFPVPNLAESVPVLFGSMSNNDWCKPSKEGLSIGIDIFGAAFFMLTRYEELVCVERDRYDRFPATASIAFQQGFLHRPIVNEYLEILWAAMKHLWPGLERSQHKYRLLLSHDVDWPLVTFGLSWPRTIKSVAGDIAARHDPGLAVRRVYSRANVGLGRLDHDLGNVFDFMMYESEHRGLESAFYFIADHSAGMIDGTYSIEHPWIRQLLRRIHQRGHEIGLHTSFNTYRDIGQTMHEADRLRSVCMVENIHQESWGGRQHFLRWSNPDTWRNWSQAGMEYDSTLSYADHVGFRCGVCYEYPAFDLETRETLQLRERPLIVMEGTLFNTTSPAYMALPDDEGLEVLRRLNEKVRSYSGDFTLLWHNSALITPPQRRLYERCLDLLH